MIDTRELTPFGGRRSGSGPRVDDEPLQAKQPQCSIIDP
jgi:hypothetical protein